MLTKLSQWVPIRFCPLLHRFLSESRDIKCYIKPRRSSLFDVNFRTLDYVIISHQALLSKTTKHGTVLWATVCLILLLYLIFSFINSYNLDLSSTLILILISTPFTSSCSFVAQRTWSSMCCSSTCMFYFLFIW